MVPFFDETIILSPLKIIVDTIVLDSSQYVPLIISCHFLKSNTETLSDTCCQDSDD